MSLVLILKQDSFLKDQPVQSSTLADNQKQAVKSGGAYEIKSYEEAGDHLKVSLSSKVVFVYKGHIEIQQDGKTVFPKEVKQVKLNMPQYWDQHENSLYPSGSCNLTSVAHCLAYLGYKSADGRLPDQLLAHCDSKGLDRHSPADMATIVEDFGFKDIFKTNATLEEVKAHLASGNPCITHSYLTHGGHIVTLVGYDENGCFVHDSWGEHCPDGYDQNDSSNNQKGKYVHYSYKLIEETCMGDGEFWVHFISK